MNYTAYHVHTELSLLDSCTNFRLYADRAAALGQNAIAFTEHGNIYNWVEKKMYCDSLGLKYLHGVEIYLTEQLEPRVRDNYHTILIAKNYDGVLELNTLVSRSSDAAHFYHKPRLSFEEFFTISKNIIKISACLASPLSRLRGRYDGQALDPQFDRLCRAYDYYEVQPHINSEDQKAYNALLLNLSEAYQKPLIAGTDTHSLDPYKAECRSLLQKSKDIVFSNEDEFDLTYKTCEELAGMFRQQGVLSESQIAEALENTNRMAESVEAFTLDTSFKYPRLYDDEETVLARRINMMYADKARRGVIHPGPEYLERLQEEFRVFQKIGMVGFMLFMSELVCWCWENGIPVGPCRGSVGGSETAYITDIIDVDPVVWGTVFSRFANEDRREIGDIDIDCSPSQRDQVYAHIFERFGMEKTAYILSTGTIDGRGCIRTIARALEIPLEEVPQICDAWEQDEQAARAAYPKLFYYFDGLVGCVISQSMHPAGIVVSPIPLADHYGVFYREGKQILCINMEEVHKVSLVKYDILGLKNIEVIRDTCELAKIPYPKSHTVDWDDAQVWQDMITSPVGVFQFESDYAFKLLSQFRPHRINDMSLVNASLRPSGASYRDQLIAREPNRNPSPLIDRMLAQNYGYLVYQEDTIKFLKDICGLSGSEADNVRRAIGRKQRDRLEAALPSILEGYCNKSGQPREIAQKEAQAFLQIVEDSRDYQFGYNHSTGYSMIGYLCAMLRFYHPVEFVAAYLNNASNEKDIHDGTQLAQQKGVHIEPIRFGFSRTRYFPDPKARVVHKGVGSIKYLNEQAAEGLYALRETKAQSFARLLADIADAKCCNARHLEILITLDYFRRFGQNGRLLAVLAKFRQVVKRSTIKKGEEAALGFTEEQVRRHAGKETDKQFAKVDMVGLLEEYEQSLPDEAVPVQAQLIAERDYLGYCCTRYDALPTYYFVTAIETKYTPWVTLYNLASGETVRIKCPKSALFYNGVQLFAQNDILEISRFDERDRVRLVDGKWVPTGEKEPILKHFAMVRRNSKEES